MKKLLSVLLSVCIALTAVSVGFVYAFAAGTPIDKTDVTWSYDSEKKVLSFGGSGAIPDYDEYMNAGGQVELRYPWRTLGYTSVVFGEGITGIGNGAFRYSEALKEVVIPDTVTALGTQIFQNCSTLESVKLPSGVTAVSENLFANCNSLKNVALSPKTVSIGSKAFYKCTSLEAIDLPEGLVSIGSKAFNACSLKTVKTPSTLTAIGDGAFYNCEQLTQAELNDGLKTIGANAFDYCVSLKSITFPESITVIPQAVCSGCSSLESVTVSNGVTEIKDEAFNICPMLKGVTLSQNVTSIGSKALGYGKRGNKVEGFTVSGYEETYAQQFAKENGYIFNSLGFYTDGICGEKAEWKYDAETKTLTVSGEGAMTDYTADNKPYYMNFKGEIEKVVISEGITRVGNYAFYDMGDFEIDISKHQSLVSVGDFAFANTCPVFAVGKAVAEIGKKAFGSYDAEGNLTEDFIAMQGYRESYAQRYAKENGIPFEEILSDYIFDGFCGENLNWSFSEEKMTLTVSGTGEMYDYTAENLPEFSVDPYTVLALEEGITSIGSYAFFGADLAEVGIPDSVTQIGEKAFGYYQTEDGIAAAEQFTLKGKSGGAAQKYAEENGFNFIPTDVPENKNGICGENVTWEYNGESKTLTVSGTGATYSYSRENRTEFFNLEISTIVVEEGVTELGDMLFLTKNFSDAIVLPSTIEKIGESAMGFAGGTEDSSGLIVKNTFFVITGYSATCADEYAKKHDFKFVSLDEANPDFGFDVDEFVIDYDNSLLYSYVFGMDGDSLLENYHKDGVTYGPVTPEGDIRTGTKLGFAIAEESFEYTIIVMGDIDCNGIINSSDALAILMHSVEQTALEGDSLLAADIDASGKINSSDALAALLVSVGSKNLNEYSPYFGG